jgi:ElaB/YqjD/DUF883 family membrane-anchored ribosome-binding protein
MVDTTPTGTESTAKASKKKVTPVAPSVDPATDNVSNAKSRFGKAIEEAKAGAEALKQEAMDRSAAYTGAAREKIAGSTADWQGEAKAYAGQAKEKAATFAKEGKTKASDALAAVGKTIADTAPTVDEKLGPQYGDYARSAARWTQETAAKLEAKELGELGDDLKTFVRNSPGAAIGIAAVAGFVVARMLGGGKSED